MPDKADIPITIEDVHLLANHNFLRLGEFFGLEKREDRDIHKRALEDILNWATEKSKSKELVDILLFIRSAEKDFVKEDPTENRVTRLRRFIVLEKDQERLDKEKALLTGQEVKDAEPSGNSS